jgi:hypothetical protein
VLERDLGHGRWERIGPVQLKSKTTVEQSL